MMDQFNRSGQDIKDVFNRIGQDIKDIIEPFVNLPDIHQWILILAVLNPEHEKQNSPM